MSPYLGVTQFILILGSNHFFSSFSEFSLTLFKTKMQPVILVLQLGVFLSSASRAAETAVCLGWYYTFLLYIKFNLRFS